MGEQKKYDTYEDVLKRIKKKAQYTSIDTSDVNADYIKSFMADSQKYFNDAQGIYDAINWGNASATYDERNAAWQALSERANKVGAYYYKNRNKYSNYDDIVSMLDELSSGGSGVLDRFKGAKDYYGQWETEDDYYKNTIGWLDEEAPNDVNNQARQQYYKDSEARIAEIKSQLPWYSNDWMPNAVEDLFLNPEQETLRNELEKLQAENNIYKNGQGVLDQYYVPQTVEFLKNGAYRDYVNPTKEELLNYNLSESAGSVALNSGGYYDAEGNIRDRNGNIVYSATSPQVQDKLGMFFSAVEDGTMSSYMTELASNNGLATNTWANIMREGDINAWQYLSEREINIYYDLLKREGQESAYRFLDAISNTLTKRETQEREEYINNAPVMEQIGLNVLSVPLSVIGGTIGIVDDFTKLLEGKEIDPYSRSHMLSNSANAIRTDTANDINVATGNAALPWLGFTFGDVYQSFMSGADSVLASFIPGGHALLGLNAASSEMKELYDRGASKGQMIAGGLLAGAAEATFEKVSIGELKKLRDLDKTTVKNFMDGLVKTLVLGGVEATEEMATEIANTISDALVMGSQSDWVDAETFIKNVVNAGLGGLLSGGAMGAVGSLANSAQYNQKAKATGQKIIDAGKVGELKEIATELYDNQKGSTAKTAMRLVKKSETAKNVGKLADLMDNILKAKGSEGFKTGDGTSIAQIKEDGKVELESGKTVDAKSVSFANESDDLIFKIATQRVSRVDGWTNETANAMVKGYDGKVTATAYRKAYISAFEMGKNGEQASQIVELANQTGIKGSTLLAAYDMGMQATEKALTNSTEGGKIESEVKTDESTGVRLRDSSKRNGSKDSQKQVSGVEESTGRDTSREDTERKVADSEAAKLADEGQKVKVSELGILNGSKTQTVTVVDKSQETSEMKKARKEAEKRGLKVRFFLGDNLVIEENGELISVRGYIKGEYVFVRADHPLYTSYQLMRHEIGHDMIAKGEVDINKVRAKLEETVGKENIDMVADMYAEAYTNSGLDADAIWEECICDSLGDMNVFSKFADIDQGVITMMLGDIKQATEDTKTAPNKTRGAPELDSTGLKAHYSRAGKKRKKLYSFPPYNESFSDANEMATRWAKQPDVKAGDKKIFFYNNSPYLVEKFDSADMNYQIIQKLTKKQYNEYIEELNDYGNIKEPSLKERTRRISKSNRQGDNIGGRGSSPNSSPVGHGGQDIQVQQLGGKQSDNKREFVGNTEGSVSSGSRGIKKYSRELDSNGNTLTEAQAEFFKDSKVRDKDGNLLVVRHGTESEFNIFDFSKAGKNGKAEGYGFYFSDEMEITKRYGAIQKEVYLNITKPLYNNKRTITKLELKKLVNSLIDFDLKKYASDGLVWQDSFLSNYLDTYEFNKSRQYAVQEFVNQLWEYNENDQDLVFEIAQADGRMYESATMQEFYDVMNKSIGYDGIIAEWTHPDGNSNVYVTFRSEQSKNISNKAPTSNPDLRYSRELDTAYLSAVERGDMETAQKMVDEAAKEAGYTETVFHGTRSGDFYVFDEERIGDNYGGYNAEGGAFDFTYDESRAWLWAGKARGTGKTRVIKAFIKAEKPFYSYDGAVAKELFDLLPDNISEDEKKYAMSYGIPFKEVLEQHGIDFKKAITSKGFDSYKMYRGDLGNVGVYSPYQIKSADPVTYDDEGNVIPLSQRFNEGNEDIRYSRDLDIEGDSAVETKPLSNRELLANALLDTVQHEVEYTKLMEYKSVIDKLEAKDIELAKLKNQIREATFGNGDKTKLKELKEKARKTEASINFYDKKLLQLESTQALKNVLTRAKREAYSKALAKGRETLHANVEGRHKTIERNRIKDIAHDLDKLLNKGTKKRNVKIGAQPIVSALLDITDRLLATDDELIMSGIVTETTTVEEDALGKYRELYNELHSTDDDVTNHKEERKEIRSKMHEVKQDLVDLLERERKRINKAKAKDSMTALIDEYAKLKNAKEGYLNLAYKQEVYDHLVTLRDNLKEKLVSEMTLDDLKSLHKACTMIQKMVTDSNKIFREGKTEDIKDRASSILGDVNKLSKREQDALAAFGNLAEGVESFNWKNLRPVDVFTIIGSPKLKELFWDVINAQDKYGANANKITKDIVEFRKKYGYKKWDTNKVMTIKTVDGDFKVTLGELMSIYAYSKREQADLHMSEGGFQHQDKAFYKDDKGLYRKRAKAEHPYRIGQLQRPKIISMLTKEQREYVDALVDYITKYGEKGNEVSRTLYGIDLFTETHYFPLKSSHDFLPSTQTQIGQTQTTSSLSNIGMSKPTTPNANNPIILQSFDDVILEHLDSMSKYNAYVIPIENLRKVLDFVDRDSNKSLKTIIGSRLGTGASNYLEQYITDLNGGKSAESGTLAKMFGRGKAAQVLASLSVWIQQYFSIIRAMSKVNPKYFIPFLGEKFKNPSMTLYEEMKTYAPITTIKEMGGFDVGSNRALKEYVGLEETKFNKNVLAKKANDIFGIGATLMDKAGWMTIWSAIKKEVAHEQGFKEGSKEYFEACRKRMNEVITETQVYDSVNARSGMMRSKSELDKFATSFMGEPTVIVGMAETSVVKLKRAIASKDADAIKEALGDFAGVATSIVLSTAMTSLAKSLIYAIRDDDEDETFAEKYATALGSAIVNDINPMNYVPYARDISSIIEGWTVDRPDMQLIEDFVNASKKLLVYNEGDNLVEEGLSAALSFANLFGLPLKNALRDIKAMVNLVDTLSRNYKSSTEGLLLKGVASGSWVLQTLLDDKGTLSKSEKLYRAMVDGDVSRLDYFKSTYEDEKSYNSALRKSLRDNDPRVEQAALARLNRDNDTYYNLMMDIIDEGIFDRKMVKEAFEAEYNYQKRLKEEAEK